MSIELTHLVAVIAKALYSLDCNSKEVLTLDEAASFLGISELSVIKLIDKGQIPFYQPAPELLFMKRTDLMEWALSIKGDFDSLKELLFDPSQN